MPLDRRSFLVAAGTTAAAAGVLLAGDIAVASPLKVRAGKLTVAAGETWEVSETTRLATLVVEDGGIVTAASGHSVTLTVDGVELGQKLLSTGGDVTRIQPGTYRGDVVLTVTDQNLVAWQTLTFPFRQALYVDATGVVAAKSVAAAIHGGRVTGAGARNLDIRSRGEAFNAVYVKDGSYQLQNPWISLRTNGRSDFVGYGCALTATGAGARLVVDGARIDNSGVMRTGVVIDGGSTIVVKNSHIATHDGELPSDYVSTVDLVVMEDAPWMLGIKGNARTTVLLGEKSTVGYVASRLSAESWGVLSTDTGSGCRMGVINCDVQVPVDGYGAYAIGSAVETFLGTRFRVGTYAAIIRGGTVVFGDSTRAAVKALDTSLGLGLTGPERRALDERHCVVESDRFGILWHGEGDVTIAGRTRFHTTEAAFLDKGQRVGITIDGSQGAKVSAANGVLVQVMDDDDPGPVLVDGNLVNAGVYTDPTGDPEKVDSWDLTTVQAADAVASFTDVTLAGDCYNGFRGGAVSGPFAVAAKNMSVSLKRAKLAGAITSTTARHTKATITAADYRLLGVVTNTPSAAVNNGTIVTLADHSTWTVTGTCHLTSLTFDATSRIRAAAGSLTMTVDGATVAAVAGTTYTGAIVLTIG
ncbi:MAG: hypothetical protein LCH96_07775 [Actinobacteria bacterium]|nr:hypothetical protein [Actinomycetota bacterium]